MSEKFGFWILGILSVAFFAWAGVVYQAVSKVERLTDFVDRHEARPWHEEAGHLIRLQNAQYDDMKADLARLELKVDAILNNTAETD